jgi:surface antigen
VALSLAVASTAAGSTGARAASPARLPDAHPATVVTSGYPYARDCPLAGAANVADRWQMDECNCTSYVAWALERNGRRTDWFVAGRMDAKNWPTVASAAGLRVGRLPAVGAVAVWPDEAPPFGHVAYVTGTHRGRFFDVAEYNLPSAGAKSTFAFGTRHGLLADDEVIFVYVPRRPLPPTPAKP